MSDETWKTSEKRIARRVFDAALQSELAELMATFKSRAANAKEVDDMWRIERYLAQARRDIDHKYDFRYSQLEMVFGCLLRERRITEQDLDGLDDDKRANIRRFAGQ